MPTIQPCNISFDKVAREWRCKYTADASGGPAESASLKAAEELLQSYLPTLKALPNAEVTRVMCGGCQDCGRQRPRNTTFCGRAVKVVINQPADDHGKEFAPEKEFVEKLAAIPGISAVETQEYTCQPL